MKTYTPKLLRADWGKNRREAWGIVNSDLQNVQGPFFTEEETLNIIGEKGQCIVWYVPSGNDYVTWEWNNFNKHWFQVEKDVVVSQILHKPAREVMKISPSVQIYQDLLGSKDTLQFHQNVLTGKLSFQFDDDEPQEILGINNYGAFLLKLQQQVVDNKLVKNSALVEFTSKEGKKMKLFIKDED